MDWDGDVSQSIGRRAHDDADLFRAQCFGLVVLRNGRCRDQADRCETQGQWYFFHLRGLHGVLALGRGLTVENLGGDDGGIGGTEPGQIIGFGRPWPVPYLLAYG